MIKQAVFLAAFCAVFAAPHGICAGETPEQARQAAGGALAQADAAASSGGIKEQLRLLKLKHLYNELMALETQKASLEASLAQPRAELQAIKDNPSFWGVCGVFYGDQCSDRWARTVPLYNDKEKAQMQALEGEISSKEQLINGLNARIEEKNKQIAQAEKEIEEKDSKGPTEPKKDGKAADVKRKIAAASLETAK